VFANVVPGDVMRGAMGQMIMFPAWLGKHSTTMKNSRLLQELCSHMHLKWAALVLQTAGQSRHKGTSVPYSWSEWVCGWVKWIRSRYHSKALVDKTSRLNNSGLFNTVTLQIFLLIPIPSIDNYRSLTLCFIFCVLAYYCMFAICQTFY